MILTEIAAAGNRTKLPVSLALSPIEAEVSDVVESMKDKAEIAMYNALGESDMARTQASKKQKRNLQAAQKALDNSKSSCALLRRNAKSIYSLLELTEVRWGRFLQKLYRIGSTDRTACRVLSRNRYSEHVLERHLHLAHPGACRPDLAEAR